MNTYNCKTKHKIDIITDVNSHKNNWEKYEEAKFIIDNVLEDKNKNDCINLIKKMLKTNVATALSGGDYFDNNIKTIIDWNHELKDSSSNYIRKIILMKIKQEELDDWQKDIYNNLKNCEKIIRFFIFYSKETYHFWILAKEPSTSDIFQYSQEYVRVLAENPEIKCDFMVFGEDEFDYSMIPEKAIII